MPWFERYTPEQISTTVVEKLVLKCKPLCPLIFNQNYRAILMAHFVKVQNAHVEITCPGDVKLYSACQGCRIRRKTIYINPDDGTLGQLTPGNFTKEFITPYSPDIVGWLLTPPSQRTDIRYGNQ